MIDDSRPDRLERSIPTLASQHPDRVYRRAAIETADPGRLVVMFYDRLLRELRSGLSALARPKDTAREPGSPEAWTHFQAARKILNALTQSIDHSTGEIAESLTSLYLMLSWQILEAELEKDGARIEQILPSIEGLRNAWAKIASGSNAR